MLIRRAIIILLILCHVPKQAAGSEDTLKQCLRRMATVIQVTNLTKYDNLIDTMLDLERAIKKGLRRDWIESRRGLYLQIARPVIKNRTIPGLKSIQIGDITTVPINVAGPTREGIYSLQGTVDGIDINVQVRPGGSYGCTVIDANAAGISISSLLREAIEEHERNNH